MEKVDFYCDLFKAVYERVSKFVLKVQEKLL
jgi:hypothetical protein